jgi:hypothetical protein
MAGGYGDKNRTAFAAGQTRAEAKTYLGVFAPVTVMQGHDIGIVLFFCANYGAKHGWFLCH